MKPIVCLVFFFLVWSNPYFVFAGNKLQYLFKNHKEGYNLYRIPTIVKAKSGCLLAFCEGRTSLRDHGNIDLVLKTSDDNGKTWSALHTIWDDGNNTCGNPSPVVDQVTGDIIVVATWNNNRVFVLRSKDEGKTWDNPSEITTSIKDLNWNWYATGPVHGIQLEHFPYKNRIVIPCNHTLKNENGHIAHTIYSDDSGITWMKSSSVPTIGTDESTIVELIDGRLLMNMRNNDRSLPNRKVSFSINGGASWTKALFDSSLIEPICQGSVLRYSIIPSILIFANPHHKHVRKNLMLSVSDNEGQNWGKRVSIHAKRSAYSDLVKLNNGSVLCIFETGVILPYSGIIIKQLPSSTFIH